MNFISQSGEHDCGFACLTVLLAKLHKDKNYLFLKHEDKPYSYAELIATAAEYNVTLLGVKIKDEMELTNAKNLPFITTIVNHETKSKHAILVLKINERHITYFDPSLGKRRERMDTFLHKWTKSALLVEKSEKTPCPITPPDFVARKDKITLPLWQSLSGLSLLVAGYFTSKESYVFLPIMFAALFVIFELMFRENMIGACKRIDVNIKDFDFEESESGYFSLYKDTEKYRVLALRSLSSVVYVFVLELLLTFILILNSPLNVIYVFLAVLLAGVEVFLLKPLFLNKEVAIMESEGKVRNAKNKYEYDFFSTEAREKAYKYGQQKMAINYVSIGIMLISIILVMALSNVVDVTYVVFYVCISFLLKSEFKKIFTYPEEQKELLTYKMRIINRLK